MRPLYGIVLAAGRGTRMRNALPKVLHPLAGRPLIGHVLATVADLRPQAIRVVLGAGMNAVADRVREICPDAEIRIQDPPLGTGDALRVGIEGLEGSGTLFVVYGDTPLLRARTLRALCTAREESDSGVVVLAIRPQDRGGYGRLRTGEGGNLLEIVEERHADAALLETAACNSGVMALDLEMARELLPELPLHADKNEIFLTDLVAAARRHGRIVRALDGDAEEGVGVNSQLDLARVEAILQKRLRTRLLEQGVIMPAPETVFLAHDTEVEPGARLEPHLVFGPGVHIGREAVIRSFSHLEGVWVEAGAVIGPFARLRPGSRVGRGCRIGNFVETKNAELEPGAKANHLSYLGDVRIGRNANIGAGTITCNYDGFGKYRTEIGEGAFIGSNSALVAPVRVGAEAIVGAGSTITREVPDRSVAIARGEQRLRQEGAPLLRERLRRRRQKALRE